LSQNIEPRTPLIVYYPFLRDDIRLGAIVYPNGKQKLLMEHFDPETGKILLHDEIDCIHTAVQDISVEDFNDAKKDKEFYEKIMEIRSSEQVKIIHLANEEKFKAMKSWVAGIAEAGMEAFRIQTEIEIANQFAYPITDKLLYFLIRVDPKFIPSYLRKMEQEGMFEGVKHEGFVISKLLPIMHMLFMDLVSHQGMSEIGRKVLAMVLDTEPPDKLFTYNIQFGLLLVYQWKYYQEILKSHPALINAVSDLIISYGFQRAYIEFSIFSENDISNPITIFLNEFLLYIDTTVSEQNSLIRKQALAFHTTLKKIQSKITPLEYNMLKSKIDLWMEKNLD
jgi:hypothetical protein